MTVLLVFIPFLLAIVLWNHVGMWLDDILFKEWRSQIITRPLFIVGNARSGTTWFHSLFFAHQLENHFTTFRTWEIVFAVSISWKVLFHYLYNLDKLVCNGFVLYWLLLIEDLLFSKISIHPIGLMRPEEDEWIMIHIGLSQLIMFFFPLGGDIMNDIVFFEYTVDSTTSVLPLHIRNTIFTFYRDAVKKHLYYQNNFLKRRHLVFISKNPAFTMRIETIYKYFPDARVVCMWRDPIESISSMVSYISAAWHAFASPNANNKYPNVLGLLRFCEAHYLHPLTIQRPRHQWMFLSYHDLINDLENTVWKMLNRLQYDSFIFGVNNVIMKDVTLQDMLNIEEFQSFWFHIKAEQLKTKSYKSSHHHSLEKSCPDGIPPKLESLLAIVHVKYLNHMD